ncbi:hypothetical protein ACFQ14_14225 [Pseudahrensia aquimaris]|uniref:Uncharacterized protein n=1 Tax=Pseudahrensia aquimaris TaxID=744461 RepID=A0ABW3FIF0_9HYPH
MQFTFKRVTLIVAIAMAALLGSYYFASQETHFTASTHHNHGSGSQPTEAGQSAFAAIAEIVAILNADQNTDWSQVDIKSLRSHLVDMNALTLASKTEMQVDGMRVRFVVTGSQSVIRAAQNMVPAHARELNKSPEWAALGKANPTGATLTMTATSDNVLKRIEALGFYGLMATGAHHQPHHLGMAKGQAMNH